MTTATARDTRAPGGVGESVRRIHALFVETLGNDAVEDFDSFRLTVSPFTDTAYVPRLVTVYDHSRQGYAAVFHHHSVISSRFRGNDENCRRNLVGAMLGAYLRRVNGSIILYAGVRKPFRRQGLYTELRNGLLSELAAESPTALGFVLSELEDDSRLLRKYLDDWGAFIASLDYVQPAVQGLSRRRLNLVVAPNAVDKAEIIRTLPTIVREVFTTVYRIAHPEDDPDFRHVVDSIGKS